MLDLGKIRDEIDVTDDEIVRLFQHRMALTAEVAQYKIETGKAVFDAERERQKLEKLTGEGTNAFNTKGIQELFQQIMSISRKRQYQLLTENGGEEMTDYTQVDHLPTHGRRVVFQGVEGAYSFGAMKEFFDDTITSFHVDTWKEAMEAITKGEADYAVLPIENSTAGIVSDIYDLLVEYPHYIVGEQELPVEHVLMALPGAKVEDIRTVISHPQALAQCRRFLDSNENWKTEEQEISRKLEALRLEASTAQQKESFAAETLNRLDHEMEALHQEEADIHETLELGGEENERKRQSVENLEAVIATLAQDETKAKAQLESWQTVKDEKNTSHKAFFEKRDELSGRISLLDKECYRLKSQIEKLEEHRESQISYMWNEYEITPNNALQYKKEELNDLKAMKKEIAQVKDEIRKLGNVNVNAIEEYKEGMIDVIVTAPINKHTIQSEEFAFPGHTEYIEQKLGDGEKALMILMKDDFRVALVTGHIPVKEIAGSITKELIQEKLKIFNRSLKQDFAISAPRIAVLSLNPHAGDGGLLGTEEQEIIIPAINEMAAKGMLCYGPYPADGFMGSDNFTHFDGILAMYHDQGLAPFKALAMDEGVNYTAGLPVIRTSPAHGTAYDIAGKGIASEDSFRQAIYVAIDVFRNRQREKEAHANPLRKQYYEKRDDSDKLKLDSVEEDL